jgi:hypothetical protein
MKQLEASMAADRVLVKIIKYDSKNIHSPAKSLKKHDIVAEQGWSARRSKLHIQLAISHIR